MSHYHILRTALADAQIHQITLSIAENFGVDVALEKLASLEEAIYSLSETPNRGAIPRYPLLSRQGYRVLITEKDLIFYKIDEDRHIITIHAVVDQRSDYLSILQGL